MKSGVKTFSRVLTIHIVQQERYAELFSLNCIAVRNSHPRRATLVHVQYHISVLVLGLVPIILFQTVRRISVFHLDCPAEVRVDVHGPARLAVPACLPLFLAIISVRGATPVGSVCSLTSAGVWYVACCLLAGLPQQASCVRHLLQGFSLATLLRCKWIAGQVLLQVVVIYANIKPQVFVQFFKNLCIYKNVLCKCLVLKEFRQRIIMQ